MATCASSPTTSAFAWTKIPRMSTRPGWRPAGSARTCAPSGSSCPKDWAEEIRRVGLAGRCARAGSRRRRPSRAHALPDRRVGAARHPAGRRLDRQAGRGARRGPVRPHGGVGNDRYGELLERLAAAARELPPVKSALVCRSRSRLPPPRRRMLGSSRRWRSPEGETDAAWDRSIGEQGAMAVSADVADGAAAHDAGNRGDRFGGRGRPGPCRSSRPSPFRRLRRRLRDERGASQVRSRRPRPDLKRLRSSVGPWRHLARAVAALGPIPPTRHCTTSASGPSGCGTPARRWKRWSAGPPPTWPEQPRTSRGSSVTSTTPSSAEEWLRAASVRPSSGAGPGGRPADRPPAPGSPPAAGQEWPASWKRLNHKKLRAWLR